MNKVKFIVLTCQKYLNTRAASIKNSWGRKENITFLSDKNGNNNDIISFDNLSSNYSELWNRYYEFIKDVDIKEDWIFFADDDTYVNIQNLQNLISTLDKNDCLYIGKELLLSERATDSQNRYTGFPLDTLIGEGAFLPLNYASGGAGFLISKNAFDKLKKHLLQSNFPARSYNTDVAFGIWMRNCNIKIINNDLFNTTNPSVLHHSKKQICNSITYHYVHDKMMEDLHSLINEKI